MNLEKEIKGAVNEAIGDFWQDFADDLPYEVRDLMGTSPADKGEPPGIRTGSLYDSLESEITSDGVELSMNDYAQHLDPIFGKGGEHPFIEKGADNAPT